MPKWRLPPRPVRRIGIDTLERLAAPVGDRVRHLELDDVQGPSSLGRGLLTAAVMLGAGPNVYDRPGRIEGFGAEPQDPEDFLPPAVRSPLTEVEDRRFFHPDSVKPLRTYRGSRTPRLVYHRPRKPPKGRLRKMLPYGISLAAKESVLMCIRRKARRGVILALGNGGGYHRKPRRGPNSNIWC